jgi:hypothetical protein
MLPENIYSQKSHRFLAQEKGEIMYTQINDIAGIFASFAFLCVFANSSPGTCTYFSSK